MGQIAIVSLHGCSPKVTECFNVESRVLCMVHVPAPRSPEPGSPAGSVLGVPTVCLGTEEGRWVVGPGAGPVRGSRPFRLRGERRERTWRGSPMRWGRAWLLRLGTESRPGRNRAPRTRLKGADGVFLERVSQSEGRTHFFVTQGFSFKVQGRGQRARVFKVQLASVQGPGVGSRAGRRRRLSPRGSRGRSSPSSRSVSVYKSSPGAKKVRLQHFFAPDKAAVLSLACSPRRLYAGLVDGAVAIYAKAQGEGSHAGRCHAGATDALCPGAGSGCHRSGCHGRGVRPGHVLPADGPSPCVLWWQ